MGLEDARKQDSAASSAHSVLVEKQVSEVRLQLSQQASIAQQASAALVVQMHDSGVYYMTLHSPCRYMLRCLLADIAPACCQSALAYQQKLRLSGQMTPALWHRWAVSGRSLTE